MRHPVYPAAGLRGNERCMLRSTQELVRQLPRIYLVHGGSDANPATNAGSLDDHADANAFSNDDSPYHDASTDPADTAYPADTDSLQYDDG
mmetsp:Transcript_56944/g.146548  ORF Transcript_56944/g.146548 Transcript_56944/m.146548 type:complete len:91 (-) Transcript_56944:296-568(-)